MHPLQYQMLNKKSKPRHTLYLAVLNKGWMRQDFVYHILPQIHNTPDVSVMWEDPMLTWDHPISSNRNAITKRFLETGCEFLLMIDNDVLPYQNPAELVFYDKDVIGIPAKVRRNDNVLGWTAYQADKDGNSHPIDFVNDITSSEFISGVKQVDRVGTGCIMIKRKVLENMKAPFNIELDDYGITQTGTDIAFCKRAKAAGFEIYTATTRFCEHIKEVGMSQMFSMDDSDNKDLIPKKYGMEWGGMSITQKDWEFIKAVIDEVQPRNILEFGCGLSSFLLLQLAPVISYEVNDDYRKEMIQKAKQSVLPHQWEPIKWDGIDIKTDYMPFDFVFVDGPLGKANGGVGRQNSILWASQVSSDIIIHDAARKDEMIWQRKYLAPCFEFVKSSGPHLTRCHYWRRIKNASS